MKESFIQFITPSKYKPNVCLGNGFSDTLDYCKNRGEVFWFNHEGFEWVSTKAMLYDQKMDIEKFYEVKLPDETSKKVYVSCLYTTHLFQVYAWAQRYPHIKFVAGGPALNCKTIKIIDDLPKNMITVDKSVEEYFGIDNFSNEWKLDVPNVDSNIVFSYTVDTSCYWKKCIYCNFAFGKSRIRDKLNYEFKNVKFDGQKIIRINTSTTEPKTFEQIIPSLPKLKNTRYDFYVRMGNRELNSLKNIDLSPYKFRFITGVEFPSDRILTHINKGISKKEIFDMMYFFKENPNINVTVFIILGWPELIPKDISDLGHFLDILPDNCQIALTRIYARPFTKLHDMYEPYRKQIMGPFYLGFIPQVEKNTLFLNRLAKTIILQKGNVMKDFTRGGLL